LNKRPQVSPLLITSLDLGSTLKSKLRFEGKTI
jgi:hypothetical protein